MNPFSDISSPNRNGEDGGGGRRGGCLWVPVLNAYEGEWGSDGEGGQSG